MVNLHLVSQNFQTYIDPGTGSLIIQMLIASSIAGLFMLKTFWAKIKAFFIRLFTRGNG